MSQRMHLLRSTRTTWCGLKVADHPNLNVMHSLGTADLSIPSCKSCQKADKAEQRRNA